MEKTKKKGGKRSPAKTKHSKSPKKSANSKRSLGASGVKKRQSKQITKAEENTLNNCLPTTQPTSVLSEQKGQNAILLEPFDIGDSCGEISKSVINNPGK